MSLSLFFLLILIFSSSTSSSTTIILQGNTTLKSPNNTFQLGLFSFSFSFYLAIRHTSLPFPNTTWVANRLHPSPTQTGSILHLTQTGSLILTHSNTTLWSTAPTFNTSSNLSLKLLDSGNLILSAPNGLVLWQSFDSPTDTWLPGMNLTRFNSLTSWRTQTDPTPGLYSLRLKPPFFGEFELVFNDTVSYWSTGNWTDGKFLNIPEMSIPYLYSFHFLSPFSPAAEFGFSERASETGTQPPTMFRVEPFGQIRQYTWNNQAGSWKMFWSMPEPVCQVRGLCGRFGVCIGETSKLCECVSGFEPLDGDGWGSGDYSKGCYRGDAGSDGSDGFRDLGDVRFGFGNVSLIKGKSRSFCEGECLRDCGCVGLSFDEGSGVCRNFYGLLSDFQNLTGGGESGGFYVRVPKGGSGGRKKVFDRKVLSGVVIGVVVVLGVVVMALLVMVKKKRGGGRKGLEEEEEDGFVPVLNLKVFSYKELQLATRGFSEKVGHGGFGTVFQGELSDASVVAVKRLERPGGGEKEFRAEVSTIGNIQHVNLVRLRGFCSENSHRLLVYEYMQNGALNVYLRKEGPCLSWDVRFRVAVGTAKGIAYLHEECRCCIIHCDIKPENILLDGDFTAKVSDFGLAKLIGRDFSRVLVTMRGTWGYVAPEWISGVAITTKADVYSYGMTLLELIGGRRNVEAPLSAGGGGGGGESGDEMGGKWFFPPWAAQRIIEGNVSDVMDKRLGNAYNIEEARRVALVAVWCIQDDEAMRPTMGMVVKMLEGLVEVSVPPPPKLLQALVTGDSFHGVKADSGNGASSTGGSLSDGDLEVSTADSESYTGNVFSPLDVNVNVSVR
ncbi:G-type lectin S-receptor-like serine/threonine-protein kinase SD2-2 [Glycine soja]|uniref:Receptor-like serine/threonine-protein kinase n=1 Tax=Glycine soja TaxID=3848 RepID=A0A445GDU1_GLYSO|nr:G-type lectin S-receptor-like serine/threonine-protein kinase SD2-2 [Glycine soja]RZB59414.1 G-type lectin S-receptor-like serine/threonine-protein kinase SD2-2 [Glycine soja]